MATAAELLAAAAGTDEKVCVINLDTRQIEIPKSIVALGVESDDNVEHLHFRIPRTYRETDLSTFSIRINYINANDDPANFAPAQGVTITEDVITFYWDVERDVVAYKGNVKFIVCLRHSDTNGVVDQELNTTLATLPVLEGLETDMESIQVETVDYLAQLKAVTESYKSDMAEQYGAHMADIFATGHEKSNELVETYNTCDENLRNTATYLSNNFGPSLKTRANAIVNSAEGSVISVNDASDDYLRGLRVFGKSTQVSTTGKNLVDLPQHIAKPSSAYNYDLFTGTSGQSTSVSSEYLDKLPYLQPGTYYFHVTVPDEYVSAGTKVLAVTDDGTIDNLLLNECGSFTLTAPTRVTIRIGSNSAFSVVDTQIESGSVYTGYEPYSGGYASPSPDWPQPNESVGSSKIHICGKNLLNTANTNKSANGVTFTLNSDKSVTINGTSTVTTFFNIDMDSEINYQGTELIASLDGSPGTVYLNIGYFAKDDRVVESIETVSRAAKTFVYPDEAVKSRVYIYVIAGTTFNNVTVRPMVRFVSNENSVYEPYKEPQTLNVPRTLPGIPVTSGGNYTDENGQQWVCDEIDFERGVYLQRIGALSLTDVDNWTVYTSDYGHYGFMLWHVLPENCSRSVGLCNQFPNVNSKSDNCVWVGVNDDSLYVVTKEWHDKGLDTWKDHLKENPLEIIYIRPTPIETPLTEAELAAYSALHSNYPTTTVMNNQGAHMEMKYNADTQIVFENTLRPTDAQVQAAVDAWLTAHNLSPSIRLNRWEEDD